MSTKKLRDSFSFDDALDRVAGLAGCQPTQRAISNVLGITEQNFSDRKKRGTLLEPIARWALEKGHSLDYIFQVASGACPEELAMAGQDFIELPKGDNKKLSEPERAALGQALEVLRASGDIEGGYAKALYQSIQMLHQGLRATRVVDQSPAAGAAAVGGSRARRKKR